MQPHFKILANTTNITDLVKDRLISLRLTDESGLQSDSVEIQLDDRDMTFEWPKHGAELVLFLGTTIEKSVRMGLYTVDEVEHTGPPNTLIIKGKASDMRSSMKAPKTRSWEAVLLGDIVDTIAQEHELTAKVSPVLHAQPITHSDQTNESDLHFLTRLAQQFGAVSKPAFGYWLFVSRGEAKAISGQSLPTVLLPKTHIIRHRLTQAERTKYAAVKAFWQDYTQAELQSVTHGKGTPIFSIRHPFSNPVDAEKAAATQLRSLQRGAATLSLTVIGNPELQAEGKLRLSNLRDPINGDWSITRVEHQLSTNGFTSRCNAELPNNTE